MKVLVTGARGFVGKAIIARLIKSDDDKMEIFRLYGGRPQKTEDSTADDTHSFYVDITDLDAVLKLKKIGVIDAVIHAAGLAHQFDDLKRENFQSVNVKGTENILELSKQLCVEHFILISSVSVYGNTYNISGKIRENTKNTENVGKKEKKENIEKTEHSECSPEGAYAESKLESEIIARQICEEAGINLTILRLATVIGEEDGGNFLRLIKAIDGRKFFWIGKGTNYKSLIHREDVAGAVFKLLKEKKKGTEIFNVAAEPLRMKEIVETISQSLNKTVSGISFNKNLLKPVFFLNSKILKNRRIEKLRMTVEKWLADDVYSSEKLRREYQYESKISVKEAINREVKWYLRK
jgi:nucleoside-diphosphate-sugar epimerase